MHQAAPSTAPRPYTAPRSSDPPSGPHPPSPTRTVDPAQLAETKGRLARLRASQAREEVQVNDRGPRTSDRDKSPRDLGLTGTAGGDPVFERVEASIVLGTVGAPLNHFVSQVGLDGGFSAELLVDCLSAGSSPPTCLFRGF